MSLQANDKSFAGVYEELQWRGLIALSTDEQKLKETLNGSSISFYCGFDPTAPSLHLGNLVQLLTMRRLQLAGHKPLCLVGGATGLIGDPKPNAERSLNTKETVSEWVEKLQKQTSRFLSTEGENATQLVNNLDWTGKLSAIDLLRDVGKYFRVGKMLSKDAVSARLNSDAGISYTEFSYQILQGYDFLELYRRYECVLQTGGSDQWGNLTAGADLIHYAEQESVHLLATPLITNADGQKFGKSEGNAVWLDAEMTSAYAFYQFWLNVMDADVIKLLKIFTFLTREEIEQLEAEVAEKPFLRSAQKKLALEVTSLVHSEEIALKVQDVSQALFGSEELDQLDGDILRSAAGNLPSVDGNAVDNLPQALVDSGLLSSLGAARRAIAEGGVYVNNQKVDSEELDKTKVLPGRLMIIRRGKKNLAAVVFD
ncbi:MAG: tyrosine--tRNA ligase [Microbacteriaceae bacterium]|nr:tyrosine--tRNA ligase [Microbacteriaceae bacterium]MDR9443706.1 tyrosine--tRNA ligase [Microbacteriaceae bacterium]